MQGSSYSSVEITAMQKDDVDLLKLDDALNRLAEIDEEIYGWFSEGFETGDLRDAKAFLNE